MVPGELGSVAERMARLRATQEFATHSYFFFAHVLKCGFIPKRSAHSLPLPYSMY